MANKWILGFLAAACLIAVTSHPSACTSFSGTYKGKLSGVNTLSVMDMTLAVQDNGPQDLTAWASNYNPRNGDVTVGIVSNIIVEGNKLTFTMKYNGGFADGTFAEYTVEFNGDNVTGDAINKMRGTKSKITLDRVDAKACPILARNNNKIVVPC